MTTPPAPIFASDTPAVRSDRPEPGLCENNPGEPGTRPKTPEVEAIDAHGAPLPPPRPWVRADQYSMTHGDGCPECQGFRAHIDNLPPSDKAYHAQMVENERLAVGESWVKQERQTRRQQDAAARAARDKEVQDAIADGVMRTLDQARQATAMRHPPEPTRPDEDPVRLRRELKAARDEIDRLKHKQTELTAEHNQHLNECYRRVVAEGNRKNAQEDAERRATMAELKADVLTREYDISERSRKDLAAQVRDLEGEVYALKDLLRAARGAGGAGQPEAAIPSRQGWGEQPWGTSGNPEQSARWDSPAQPARGGPSGWGAAAGATTSQPASWDAAGWARGAKRRGNTPTEPVRDVRRRRDHRWDEEDRGRVPGRLPDHWPRGSTPVFDRSVVRGWGGGDAEHADGGVLEEPPEGGRDQGRARNPFRDAGLGIRVTEDGRYYIPDIQLRETLLKLRPSKRMFGARWEDARRDLDTMFAGIFSTPTNFSRLCEVYSVTCEDQGRPAGGVGVIERLDLHEAMRGEDGQVRWEERVVVQHLASMGVSREEQGAYHRYFERRAGRQGNIIDRAEAHRLDPELFTVPYPDAIPAYSLPRGSPPRPWVHAHSDGPVSAHTW